MALRKKVYGVETPFSVRIFSVHCTDHPKEKAENLLRRNQKLATSEDFNCSCNLSAIRAINSEARKLDEMKMPIYLVKYADECGGLLPCLWR